MPQRLEPKLGVLPPAQKEIWASLASAARLNFVLYGGTAMALHLGHRESLDFDFFRSRIAGQGSNTRAFEFIDGAAVLQDAPRYAGGRCRNAFGPVKVSYFGNIGFGRINDPLQTRDGTLLVASLTI